MSLPNGYLGRSVLVCTIAIVLAGHVAPLDAVAAAPVLLEGFEKPPAAGTGAGVKTVTSGPGLTQGRSAAELSPGGAIAVQVRGVDIANLPWLRLDTHHTGDGTRGLKITVNATNFGHRALGYVQTGKDTLAFPLIMVVPPVAKKPDKRVFTIRITNSDDIPIVVDNLRLEPLVRKPRGAVLLDFGKSRSRAWPGFIRQGVSSKNLKWKGESSYYTAYSLQYPDPLTRDFVGPYSSNLGNNSKVPVGIIAPKPVSMAGWLWVTHYGKGYTQPQEYICRAAMSRGVGKKLTPSQLVGPGGLLEGAGGLWTPQWYATNYADHFVTLMPFTMLKGKAMVELGNCQIAALAMVPSSGRSSMSACIKQIQKELVRFRRQFVMKHLERNPCRLEPTDTEKKLGLMLFRVPPDDAFTGLWKPRADQRVWAIHEIARPGGTVRIPLAFVPLQRKSVVFSITPGSLRSDSGSVLVLNRNSFQIDRMQLVPEVRKGIAIRRPWLAAGKSQVVDVGEIGYVWLTATIPPHTKGGVYRGTWKLGSGAARTDIPVEIEIVDCGRPDAEDTEDITIGSYSLPAASAAYYAALPALPKARQQKLKSNVFKQITAIGINSYSIPAVKIISGSSSGSYSLYTPYMQRALDEFPFKELRGPMFLDLNQALGYLSWGNSTAKRELLGKAIARSNALSSKYSINRRYFYFGYSNTMAGGTSTTGLTTRLAGAKRFASEACPVAIRTLSSVLKELSDVNFKTKLKPVSALILTPDSSSLASQIATFKKLSGARAVYLHLPRADRFAMGFYTAAIQADGYFVSKVFMSGGPYNGYYIDGNGLVAPQAGGRLAKTVSAFRMKQARDDRNLFYLAGTLVARAVSAGVTTDEISDVLSEIRSRAASLKTLRYDDTHFATTAVSQAEMDSWRVSLLNAMGIVNGRLTGAKRK
ncbi:MAG: hypothetical protein QGG42_01760 [Phycisphaerae bacterium]|nr:hypothetical protein [Phycisphaerae bacterium]